MFRLRALLLFESIPFLANEVFGKPDVKEYVVAKSQVDGAK